MLRMMDVMGTEVITDVTEISRIRRANDEDPARGLLVSSLAHRLPMN